MNYFFLFNKHNFTISLAIALLIKVLSSCSNDNRPLNNNGNHVELHCLNCSKGSEPIDAHFPYNDVKMIKLETTSDCLITHILEIVMTDSLIFIRDQRDALFLFNIEGNFICQIGQKGQGPTEYITIDAFFINNNRVGIVDHYKERFLFYNFEGKFISSTESKFDHLDRSNQALLTNNNQLLIHNDINFKDDNTAYRIIDMNTNQVIGNYYTYNPIKLDSYRHYFSNNAMAKSNDEIHFIMPLCDTIFSYADSTFSVKYIVKTYDNIATKQQIEYNTKDLNADMRALLRQGYFTGFKTIFETDNFIFLGFSVIIEGFFIFDKNSKEGYQYLYSYDDIMNEIPFFTIIGSQSNDKFIGFEIPETLLMLTENAKWDNIYLMQLKEILDNSKEDDNPILFIYELKSLKNEYLEIN